MNFNNLKVQPWLVQWPDGVSYTKSNAGQGECKANFTCAFSDLLSCWAQFGGPNASSGSWQETEINATAVFTSGTHPCPNNNGYTGWNMACVPSTHSVTVGPFLHTCNCPCTGSPTFMCSAPGGSGYVSPRCQGGQFVCPAGATQCSLPPPSGGCPAGDTLTCGGEGQQIGGNWTCLCSPGNCGSCPILIDTQNQGFHLTDWQHGVTFGFYPDNAPIQLSWTDASYANGWLALDRDGDGLIDNGTELFGNITPQPPSDTPNGFLALAVFDEPANGGNGNGFIDPGDAVYPHLRVWIDANHDGISQPDELKTLQEVGIFRIDLKYRWTPFVDQYGNQFRYRGTVWDGEDKEREATYDVFLTAKPRQK
jgi:hypothetical protein